MRGPSNFRLKLFNKHLLPQCSRESCRALTSPPARWLAVSMSWLRDAFTILAAVAAVIVTMGATGAGLGSDDGVYDEQFEDDPLEDDGDVDDDGYHEEAYSDDDSQHYSNLGGYRAAEHQEVYSDDEFHYWN